MPYWDGDLEHFSTRATADPSDVAAEVVSGHGHARAWLNLRLCPRELRGLVWLRLRWSAARGPFDVLYAEDVAALVDDPAELGC